MMPSDDPQKRPPPQGQAAMREAKLAQALRANLRRRKAEAAQRPHSESPDAREPGDST